MTWRVPAHSVDDDDVGAGGSVGRQPPRLQCEAILGSERYCVAYQPEVLRAAIHSTPARVFADVGCGGEISHCSVKEKQAAEQDCGPARGARDAVAIGAGY